MSLLCDNCGEPLVKEGDHFVCRHCGSIYEENHDALLEGLASILGEAKMEKLAASRRLLYEASHAKYPSKQKVVESARRVLEIHPDDYLAKLYLLLKRCDDVLSLIRSYVDYYNNERPMCCLGYKTPCQYRADMGY
jgi:hypothetical protein